MSFDKFTDKARKVLVLAQDEARGLHQPYVGTEHILLGLIQEKEGLAARPVLAADTAVILGTRILGKPENREEEIRFLKALSGTTHTVRTALVVAASPMQLLEAVSVSHVHFRTLTEEEIAWYSATKEPYDKAGGYAVQGLAAIYIDHIDGSFSGIMGLPAYQTAALLKTLGIEPSEN